MTRLDEMPWHAETWARLSGAWRAGQLGHALLIHGAAGVGKMGFAERLLCLVLCEASDNEPCGSCRSCHLFSLGHHPGAWRLTPQDAGGIIGIDAVRDLAASLTLTTQQGWAKGAIIAPAEAMNRPAANALLKTLEEPPGASYLFLVSDVPSALPATIRSRCQSVAIATPPGDQARAWLNATAPDALPYLDDVDGAPLAAIGFVEQGPGERIADLRRDLLDLAAAKRDPVEAVATWRRDIEAVLVVRTMRRLADGLVRLKFGLPAPFGLETPILTPWVERIEFPVLFELSDAITRGEADLRSSISLNEQLMLEHLAARWTRLAEPE